MSSGDVGALTSGSAIVLGKIDNRLSPLEIHRQVLEIVVAALAGEGIPHFRVRGYSPTNSVVAVPATKRVDALNAVRQATRRCPLYVGAVEPTRALKLGSTVRLASWSRIARADVVKVVRFHGDPSGNLVVGPEYGCEIEFWQEEDGNLHAPRPNRAADVLAAQGSLVSADEATFNQLAPPAGGRSPAYVTREEFAGHLIDEVTFPIDVVYTWVDGSDPEWQARRDLTLVGNRDRLSAEAANESRFTNRDELRYSMRSLALFAPWVNHIWLVVDDQVPSWLDNNHQKITVVSHRELFGTRGMLPTFNSHAIETQLHQIAGLTEHFLYFNDDVLLGRPVFPSTFFEANGLSKVVLSNAKVDPGPVSSDDTPATAAGKNNRELIGKLGPHVTYKLKHCPHPLRRSVLTEVAERFRDVVEMTSTRQFRHPSDVSLTSSLYQYYALATGRAVVGDLRYMYANVAHPSTPRRLTSLCSTRDIDVMCLNDTDTDTARTAYVEGFLTTFMKNYFPVLAPWEMANR